MAEINTIRVVVVDASAESAEQHLNVLRAEGLNIRPALVNSTASLHEALAESQWDLCLAVDGNNDLMPMDILNILAEADSDMPMILLTKSKATKAIKSLRQSGVSSVVKLDDNEELVHATKRDVQSLQQRRSMRGLEKRLQDSERLCRELLETSREALAYIDGESLTYANPTLCQLFGHSSFASLKGQSVADLIAMSHLASFKRFLSHFHENQSTESVLQCTGKRMDGTEFELDITLTKSSFLGDDATRVKVERQFLNTSSEEANGEASKDLLTGLFNREYLVDAIDNLLADASGSINNSHMFYVMLDDFAACKQQLGLAGSDLVLSDFAKAIKASLPKDGDLAARYSDEALIALLPDTSEEEAQAFAEKLQQAVQANESTVGKNTYRASCHIGVCQLNANSPNSQEVISRAHQAYKTAKQTSQRIVFYHHKQAQNMDEGSKKIITQIQEALDGGNLQLKYQPLVSLHGDSKQFYEVLVRMWDNDGNFLRADEFLPVANKAGMLGEIDRWIISKAIELLAEHRMQGNDTYLFIMLAGPSLGDRSLLPWISESLQAARLPSDALIFEMSETDAAANLENAIAFTQGLKQLHCRTAITHFGSGLNSFHVLKQLAVDFVKLDGMFPKAMHNDTPGARKEMDSLVKSIHAQGKLAIVPMVEDARMMSVLWQLGANYIQGYFLSPPSEVMDYNFEGHFEDLE